MCGAFGVITPENILSRFDINTSGFKFERSYNIRPSGYAPIITRNSPNSIKIARFGFVPSWSKEAKPKIMPINARAETVSVSGLFKGAFTSSRCIVPANFWYEWLKTDVNGETIKLPFAYKIKDQEVFGFAGIYSMRRDAEDKEHYTFAIITTKANKVAAKVHPRMPVVLHREDENKWLDSESETKALLKLLIPYEDNKTEVWRVSTKVNSAASDGEELIKAI